MSGPRPQPWRVLVAGGGIPSLAFALATRQAAGEAVALTILDPRPNAADGRAYALSPASVLMLERLGLWAGLRPQAQPIAAMRITDSRADDAVRPRYLGFGDGGEDLGTVIEAAPLRQALAAACREAGVATEVDAIAAAEPAEAGLAITLAGGSTRRAALLVAADGARSRLREAAGIGWVGRRYRQLGLVATIAHERDGRGVAVQHFLPGGPFAILPLAGSGRAHPHRSSIVWTEEERAARRLLAAAPAEQTAAIEARFGRELGRIAIEGPVVGHSLAVGLARRFVAPRLALLGDAAHEIHPLAGQGLNLGLGDAAALAESVVEAARLGLDPGAAEVLARYERARRFDALLLAGLTDGLNRLFSNDALPARFLRDLGLGLVDRAPGLKRWFGAQASGLTARAPRLMRGEAI